MTINTFKQSRSENGNVQINKMYERNINIHEPATDLPASRKEKINNYKQQKRKNSLRFC